MKHIIFLFAFLFTLPAMAQADFRTCPLTGPDNGRVLTAVPLNGAASTLTFVVDPIRCGQKTASFSLLVLKVNFTHVTSGNVVVTCTTGHDTKTATATPQICTGSAGTCIAEDAGIVSKAVTGDKEWAVRIGIHGYRAWSCTVSHDNTPAAGDLVTVHGKVTD